MRERMRKTSGNAKKQTVRVVQKTPRREQDATPRPTLAPPAAPAKAPRRPAVEAWTKIAAPLTKNEGQRLLFFGGTGWGKTTGIKDYLAYIIRHGLVDVVFIHDVKKPEAQYEAPIIHEARQATGEGAPAEYPATRVLRRRGLDHMPSVEDAARVTMEQGYDGVSTMLVVDEFQRALTDGGTFEAPHVRRIFCEGLGLHASIIGAKQLPQNVPTEATGQSTKVYFHMAREGTNFLVANKKISGAEADLMNSLDVGEFIYYPEDGDPDGFVYQVPAP